MSRAYRIQLSESLRRTVVVGDQVRVGLGLLDVLPREQMAELLAQALADRGFEPQSDGTLLRREADGVEVVVDPVAATVTLRQESVQEVVVSTERDMRVVEETAEATAKRASQEMREALEVEVEVETEAARKAVTDALEKRVGGLHDELDRVVNQVVGAALKRRAAQLGEVTEIREDAETGSLTIKVKL